MVPSTSSITAAMVVASKSRPSTALLEKARLSKLVQFRPFFGVARGIAGKKQIRTLLPTKVLDFGVCKLWNEYFQRVVVTNAGNVEYELHVGPELLEVPIEGRDTNLNPLHDPNLSVFAKIDYGDGGFGGTLASGGRRDGGSYNPLLNVIVNPASTGTSSAVTTTTSTDTTAATAGVLGDEDKDKDKDKEGDVGLSVFGRIASSQSYEEAKLQFEKMLVRTEK